MRLRQRYGLIATLALGSAFLLILVQYAYISSCSSAASCAAALSGTPSSRGSQSTPAAGQTNSQATAFTHSSSSSWWPWSKFHLPYVQDQFMLGEEAEGEDPPDDDPVFAEIEKMPDPLDEEFMNYRGEYYVVPPKPPYKQDHAPEDRQKAEDDRKNNKTSGILDPFPLLSQLDRASAQKYLPPQRNTKTRTPLLIGFTRNWPLLLQCVASYMAAGWPARDIYVVENTGVMGANAAGRLSLQNPFFLNHTQLVDVLGVHVLETPTLFTFSQLQNFYLYTALQKGWRQYFWSHQDVFVFSEEGYVADAGRAREMRVKGKKSLHHRALAALKALTRHQGEVSGGGPPPWATHFFNYDRLTLVNRDAYLAVGAWDPHISFYASDCDIYLRLKWAGYWQGMLLPAVGRIFDVASVLDDLGAVFRVPGIRATVGGRGVKWNATTSVETAKRSRIDVRRRWGHPDDSSDDLLEPESVENLTKMAQLMQDTKNDAGGSMAETLEQMATEKDEVAAKTDAAENDAGAANATLADHLADRNAWQRRQQGGQGEPFYRDPEGFEAGLRMHIATGRRVFADKWGHRGCDLDVMGIVSEDAWQLERDWDPAVEQGNEGGNW